MALLYTDLNLEDGTTFVCEASNTYGRDQYHVSVELGGIRKLLLRKMKEESQLLGDQPSKEFIRRMAQLYGSSTPECAVSY